MKKKDKKLPARDSKSPYQLPTAYPTAMKESMKSEQSDPFGSYTGVAVDNEVPVQDVDDL